MKHALILGVGGIVGFNLAKHLLINREWKVTGVLRRPREYIDRFVQETDGLLDIVCVDLLDPNAVKAKLGPKVSTITHLFHVTWCPSNSEQQRCADNTKMLENVLNLFEPSEGKREDGAPVTSGPFQSVLKHVYLQTGTKYYYMPTPNVNQAPFKEDMDRLPGPNFYYSQEDLLYQFAERSKKRALTDGGSAWTYTIGRPNCILGYTQGTQMNFGVSLAVYASIMKELGRPLVWPFGEKAYNALREFSTADIISKFILWQIHNRDHVNGEAFNIANGDVFRFSQLWPLIAEYFDLDVEIADKPFDIEKFMESKDVQDAWKRLVEQHSLRCPSLKELCTFDFMKFIANREWDDFSSLEKLRKFGFLECENTETSLYGFFDSLQNMRVIPLQKRTV